jgi:ubiquinone/menaquinone biosynthesis C-methylase UbiE
MKRVVIPELLDSDSGTPAEVADSLLDLQGINRCFGGVATTQAMIELVAGNIAARSLSLLEVAAGSGYVPAEVQRRVRSQGLQVSVTLLDRTRSHLGNGNQAVVGDALKLPFRDASFDLLSCTLFAHHLEPYEVTQFAREALRVCRVAVLINDLVRHPLHLALVRAATPIWRSRITRHDGPASVRRAYTPDELRELLAQSGAGRVEIYRHYLFRMGVIVWKH